MNNLFISNQIIKTALVCSLLVLGYSCCKTQDKKEITVTMNEDIINSYQESIAKKAIRDSVPANDPVNVIIKRDDLKLEINNFIDTLYNQKSIMPEVKGVSLIILKNTENDFAIKLKYAEPLCSERLVGITDYSYKGMTIYLMSKSEINNDFFKLKYKAICEELEDLSTLINKTHYIQYYEMIRNIPQKILYYQKKDGEYVLTDTFLNDSDIPK